MGTVKTKNATLQPRAQRTRRALVESASLEFGERGYEGTTAKTITERAGVAVGTFYQYFENKSALLREVALGYLTKTAGRSLEILETQGMDADLEQDTRRRFREVTRSALKAARDDDGLHAVLRERRRVDPDLQALWQEAERKLIDRIAALLTEQGFRGDCSAIALVLFGMVDGALEAHIDTRMLTDRRFLDAVSDTISAVLVAELPAARR